MALLDELDRQTQTFAAQTGLKCKDGCGACCQNPDVETTVTEVLPLAVHVWSAFRPQKAVDSILESLRRTSFRGVCVFYKPDPSLKGQGRCSVYAYRPGLCRLFGFSARRDKYGKAQLVTCKVIKNIQPGLYTRAQTELQKGIPAPFLTALALSVYAIDPHHGGELLPINRALALSLEKIGYSVEKTKQSLPI